MTSPRVLQLSSASFAVLRTHVTDIWFVATRVSNGCMLSVLLLSKERTAETDTINVFKIWRNTPASSVLARLRQTIAVGLRAIAVVAPVLEVLLMITKEMATTIITLAVIELVS